MLYGLPYSSYCAKVRIALRLKRLDFEEVAPPSGYRSDAYRLIMPVGSIPALDIGDQVLFESNAIIEYLDEIASEPPLLPSSPKLRAIARSASGYHDGRVEPVVRTLFPLIGRSDPDREAFLGVAALLTDRLERLSETLAPEPFIAGDRLSLGDIGYPGTLMMAQRILEEGNTRLSLPPRIEAWNDRLLNIPMIQEVVLDMERALRAWINSKNMSS